MLYRNPKLLADAKDKSCICCGRDDGTTIAAHYSGIEALSFGKGMGIKAHDLCADLCHSCHNYFDGYKGGNDYDRGFKLFKYIHLSLIRRLTNDWELRKTK